MPHLYSYLGDINISTRITVLKQDPELLRLPQTSIIAHIWS